MVGTKLKRVQKRMHTLAVICIEVAEEVEGIADCINLFGEPRF